jgi:general secretion pathway protein M
MMKGLAPREQRALQLAAWLLGLLLVWSVAVAPAWRVLQSAPERQARLGPQLQAMRTLAAEARALQQTEGAQAPAWPERLRALEASSERLLKDQIRLAPSGEQVSVTLQEATPEALAQWLEDVRINARLRPTRMQLERAGNAAAVRWHGTLVLGDAVGAGA